MPSAADPSPVPSPSPPPGRGPAGAGGAPADAAAGGSVGARRFDPPADPQGSHAPPPHGTAPPADPAAEHAAELAAEHSLAGLPSVPFGEAVVVWARVAALSFGGPAGQIAVMHRILVEEKRWIDEARFLHALNYCMLLPGPEAQQLATYVGWLLHGVRGGLVAGGLFVLPGFLAILALSVLYVLHRDLSLVEGLLFGLQAGVLALVLEALLRLGRRALKRPLNRVVAAAAFGALFLFDVPFPAVVATAAGVGLLAAARRGSAPAADGAVRVGGPTPSASAGALLKRSLGVLLAWGSAWVLPLLLLALWLGPGHVLAQQALFFSKAALVTFGGAYAVLAYVAQQAVEVHGWLRPGEMLDGLGFAESTPGPLIQVVQFVGFLGAWRAPAPFPPLAAAVLGSVVTTWATFAPCFLWIFLGAPFVERLRGSRLLDGALSAITAAVVGVIANLALWFWLHVLFAEVGEARAGRLRVPLPEAASLQVPALVLALLAVVALLRFRAGMLATLLGCVVAGAAWRLLAG